MLDNSTCQCSVGGKISIIKFAQNFVEEGGSTIYQPIVYERNEKKDEDEKDDDRSWVINWVPKDVHGHGINMLADLDDNPIR
ncbi:hypothetical protein [Chryseobacterium luteum]|uniref:Uncharacterized protein n=1 Tax=Chryseobacterium luteum TaxID=421531 RepID=A0A085YY31_9FLAO|nr:hypothetical protein [Chryseobacterium luteum]KFE97094.1 hypothetical protein IX38_21460 [Chryseobacterium luteum]